MSYGPLPSEQETTCYSKSPKAVQAGLSPLSDQQLEGATASGLASDRLHGILESIDDGVVVLDPHRQIVFSNEAARRLLGDRLSQFSAPNWAQCFQGLMPLVELPGGGTEDISLHRAGNSIEIFLTHRQAPKGLWLSVTERALSNEAYGARGSVIICRNISQYKEVEERLLHDAFHDRLTGLPNRNYLLRQLESAIQRCEQIGNHEFAVLFLDLDRFKVINDSLGPVAGDQLLTFVAQRLKRCLREDDTIVRLGGDEFAILLTQVKRQDYSQQVAERIHQELINPFCVDGHEVFANVSIGIANGSHAYQKPEEILRDADIAMHRAKKEGKAGSQTFDKAMHVNAVKLLHLENDIRRAVDREEFHVHYQPIISLHNKEIAGFEALLRWRHPNRGIVGPSEFIPVAEETGLISTLGLWVLRESCYQMRLWQLQFPQAKDWVMSVNISGRQLLKPLFLESVERTLVETGMHPKNLKLEITESVLLSNSHKVTDVLHQLQGMGIQLAMDDFGTGYSSMSYLLDFPFNTLKIDRSFINSMEHSSKKLGVVRSIIAMCTNLELSVIAEGIETPSHLAQLKVLKCGYGQGFLFSKALPPQEAETFINSEMVEAAGKPDADAMQLLAEQMNEERLLLHIENLQQELEEVKQEKNDLEILLDNATEHASLVESELEREITDYQKTEAELQKVNQALENLSISDGLTQLANRRRFDEYLEEVWEQLQDSGDALSLVMLDVDYFKHYNDTYGHQAGDDCLMQLAQVMEVATQGIEHCLAARYGGEEFAVVLPSSHAGTALEVAERIRRGLKAKQIPHSRSMVSPWVTVSLGIVNLLPTAQQSVGTLITAADRALYQAKAQGRDRFILFSS